MTPTAPPADTPVPEHERSRVAERATWVSAVLNLLLTIVQIVVGWIGNSQSLIAHGIHSFSDLLSDVLVLVANRKGNHPADAAHPYGHARVETAATLVLGISLLAVGGGILWDAVLRLQSPIALVPASGLALFVAVLTVVSKEGLYRYLMAVADRLRSRLLAANAMHTRADAASALVVVAGVAGSLLGWPILDVLAAVLMGGLILKLGAELSWGALAELIDTGLEAERVAVIRKTLLASEGVRGVHELRTRRMAHRALVDAHLLVDPRISVSEGHRVAEFARTHVLKACPEVLDVLVHIDPEEDLLPVEGARAPGRRELEAMLAPCLEGLPPPERMVFHFLDGRVEAEVHFAATVCPAPEVVGALERRAQAELGAHPVLARVSFHWCFAPITCKQAS